MTYAKKKSQAAMEFLLTYGWAIILVLVVIAALVYYGVLDPTMLLPEKCVLQSGPLACTDSKAFFFQSTNGQVHLEFTNVLDKTVQIESIKLSREGYSCEPSIPRIIVPGGKACIPMFCERIPKKWSKQGFEMEIKYSTGDAGLQKVLSGDLYVRLEEIISNNIKGCQLPPGDGNGDGVIDDKDIALISDYMNGLSLDESVPDYWAYDVDNDSAITVVDINILNNLINGCRCCEDKSLQFEIMKKHKENRSVDMWAECRKNCLSSYGSPSQCLVLESPPTLQNIPTITAIMDKCRCCARDNNLAAAQDVINKYLAEEITEYEQACRDACGRLPPCY